MDPFLNNKSDKKGLFGKLEQSLRRLRGTTFLVFYFLVALSCVLVVGLSLVPALAIYQAIAPANLISQGLTLALCYFSFGLSLIVVVPTVHGVLRVKKYVKPFRGNVYSLEAMPWFLHNALIYVVRYLFLEFVTPSPLNLFFYRSMGMKIGKGVVINTTNISDACLIELGDYVTIGGSAHLLTHYSQAGYLVLSTLKIGDRSTVGLKASVFGNVEIGRGCTIKPHTVVLPKSRIADDTAV